MTSPTPPAPPAQPRNPLHGLTLEAIVTALVAHYGWQELGRRIPVRCFTSEPSVSSSLKFLRKTPWAREKVERLYREVRATAIPGGSEEILLDLGVRESVKLFVANRQLRASL